MNYCLINGNNFGSTVAISAIEETFNTLDGENAGRSTLSGRMIRDIIGTYVGHKITFFNGKDNNAFDALWDYLIAHSVDDYVVLEACDDQSSISYEAYYTSGTRKIKDVTDGVNHWDEIEINFIPMEMKVSP